MANRLRATAQPLLGAGAARLTVAPALLAQGPRLLVVAALLRAPAQARVTAQPLLGAAQARLTAVVPTLRATAAPLLATAQARLVLAVHARGLAPALLGAPLGLGWPWFARGEAPALFAAASGRGSPVISGQGQCNALGMGAAGGRGRSYGDAWLAWFDAWFAADPAAHDPARLCPTVTGYRYRSDAGLSRVPMTDGVIRQRRLWTNARATLGLRFVLTLAEIEAAEAFLEAQGGDWFTLRLVTGQGGGAPALHLVRMTEDSQIRALNNLSHYELLLTVETAGDAAAILAESS